MYRGMKAPVVSTPRLKWLLGCVTILLTTFILYVFLYNEPRATVLAYPQPQVNIIPNQLDKHSVHKDECDRSKPLVVWKPKGRLGNIICEYVHLLKLADFFSVDIRTSVSMHEALAPIFPHLSVKTPSSPCESERLKHVAWITYPKARERLLNQTNRAELLVIWDTPCDVMQIWQSRLQWLSEFIVNSELKEAAALRLQNMTRNVESLKNFTVDDDTTLVGIHVRRSDYWTVLDKYNFGGVLPRQYYEAAFKYYRKRFEKPLFIVITEPGEYDWCRENLSKNSRDVILADDRRSPEEDLILLSSFAHIIYSHGSFGVWGILLSEAETVAYPDHKNDGDKVRYPPHQAFDEIGKMQNRTEYITIMYKSGEE
ncbi:galactoside alpha-(1,2)-fucosyltransferase 2 [Hyalella azteca]|uniref:L-Fucosyltransferase n=1 Tax=Hyalella azteca TaxID=294128 RepID=A0A8B7PI03_HYAAZ|nr:galactoside alpha-(1,2)-fucosyltransferase 2 [Hyalella azteca]